MNGEDQFEKRLQRQRMKSLPAAWRREILDTAREAAGQYSCSSRGNEALTSKHPGSSRILSLVTSAATNMVSNLIWPTRKAWAGLAAVWVLILGLNFASRDSERSLVAQREPVPSPLVRELLWQQEKLFVELIGPRESEEAITRKRILPGPRSQRRESLLQV